MLHFMHPKNIIEKKDAIVYADFDVEDADDILIYGKEFKAIWDESKGLWLTSEKDVQRLCDSELRQRAKEVKNSVGADVTVKTKLLKDFSSGSWVNYRKFVANMYNNYQPLDQELTFSNTPLGVKEEYRSKVLPYSLEEGDYSAWDELVGTLYAPEERQKLEWAIGSIVSGDSRTIQKFVVLYGEGGTGKSTILNIIKDLFDGYTAVFNAKELVSANNSFSTEALEDNPLVLIQYDGDLSKIEDNTKLNTIVAHEPIVVNGKYKRQRKAHPKAMLFLGTNHPVKITDQKSGVIRRLIDIEPTGNIIPAKKFSELMQRISFQKGAIAYHCLSVYRSLGKHYYDSYRSLKMMFKTDPFFNFVEDNYIPFSTEEYVTQSAAYAMYAEYCKDNGTEQYKLPSYKFREELKNYFREYYETKRVDGKQLRKVFSGFKTEKFEIPDLEKPKEEEHPYSLVLDQTESLFDKLLADCPAQYATEGTEIPYKAWDKVTKTLKDIDTSRVHYVNIPESMNIITIDFDLKDESGKKNAELNLAAASEWIPTYAEYSKSGVGIHLEYFYTGDASLLNPVYKPGIEVKVCTGNNSLRRKLTFCNNIPLATISSGLPLKEKKMVNFNGIEDEKHLVNSIKKNLRKQNVSSTKQSIDLIYKDLEEFYKSGRHYDVTSFRQMIETFANNSTNHAPYCIKLVNKMKFHSDDVVEDDCESAPEEANQDSDPIVFFDVEVFPNLFLINWKIENQPKVYRMINPSQADVERFMHMKLVGFNCRRYDNHIVYARYLGKSNQELYELSQRIIAGSPDAFYGLAYDISYTDVYDFCSKKQSLKKWEIELGIHHQELGLPWDQPVPEEMWQKVAEYCDNDVIATEAVFHERQDDWHARIALARVAGMNVNTTTNQLTTRFIFGKDREPQGKFNYRFMGIDPLTADDYEMAFDDEYSLFDEKGRPVFKGYEFNSGKSTYRGEEVGEGGYVYAKPGIYWNVSLLDIASMHPSSIVAEDLFGDLYTARFKEILDARILVKHREWAKAREALGGQLAAVLEGIEDKSEEEQIKEAKNLSLALKIAINSVYGLTSAKFKNSFKDDRNKDNIVAKRGALFMVNLKHLVQERGFTVAHIKTDSIKIPNATPEIIQFVMDYGKKYGYNFELESVYDRMCLVNDTVYVAHGKSGEHAGEWITTGAQFQDPFVKKTLFTKEKIQFEDLCRTKAVSTNMYLDMNESLPKDEHNYVFVGKAGSFCPIKSGKGGGILYRQKDDKYDSVAGTKGFRWLESEVVKSMNMQDDIDMDYYTQFVNEAIHDISQYGDFEIFRAIDE